VVGRMSVDEEAAITAPVRLAALHESAAGGPGEVVASTRPDWVVVGAIVAGVAILLALGALAWMRSPVATANTTGPTSAPVATAPPAPAPPAATTAARLPLPAQTVRPSAKTPIPAPVPPQVNVAPRPAPAAPQVNVAPRPTSGGTASPPSSGNGNGNGGNGDGGGQVFPGDY
jgi:cytoskeletal protein RodZ